jgi:hypothetical protein
MKVLLQRQRNLHRDRESILRDLIQALLEQIQVEAAAAVVAVVRVAQVKMRTKIKANIITITRNLNQMQKELK